jgi:hypothetical protein
VPDFFGADLADFFTGAMAIVSGEGELKLRNDAGKRDLIKIPFSPVCDTFPV